jgi:hypothetical protein
MNSHLVIAVHVMKEITYAYRQHLAHAVVSNARDNLLRQPLLSLWKCVHHVITPIHHELAKICSILSQWIF